MANLRDMNQQVLSWLRPDDGDLASISQHDAQELAWYTAPYQWRVPDRDLRKVAEVCARLLAESGRHRAATVLREHTPAVLASWARSVRHGATAYSKAMQATGVQPPDTPTLSWGQLVGSDEAEVLDAAERMLESALDAGSFVPGERGWRRTQSKLVEAWLRTPSTLFAGRAPIDVVHAERAARWAGSGTAARCMILRPVLPLISAPPEQAIDTAAIGPGSADPSNADPSNADSESVNPESTVEPLRLLLDTIDRGITLTAAGHLPPAWIRETAARFGWGMPAFKIRKEADVVEIVELRDLATRTGLILFRRRQRQLVLTDTGRAVLADPAQLWSAAVAGWFDLDDFAAHTAEIAAAVLLNGPATAGALTKIAHDAVAGLFLDRDGDHPSPNDVRTALWDWLRPGHALGWLSRPAGTAELQHQLTDAGRAAVRNGLRHRAHAPYRHPMG